MKHRKNGGHLTLLPTGALGGEPRISILVRAWAVARRLAGLLRTPAATSMLLAAMTLASPAGQLDRSGLVLSDNLEPGGFAPEGGLYYKLNDEQRAGLVLFQNNTVRSGLGALTLTVNPLCAAQIAGCSERAEVWERPEVMAPYDKAVWYGLAVLLQEPLPRDGGRHVIAQWKRQILPGAKGDYSPFLAIRLFRGRLGVTVETDMVATHRIGSAARPDGCRPGEALVMNRTTARQTRALVALEAGSTRADYPGYFNACAPGIQVTQNQPLPPATSGWIDFVIRSGPGPDGTGHIEVIANGQHVVTVKGAIGHRGSGLGSNQYFKFGPYRAASRDSWSVSYDDFRRGPRCADVIREGQCPPE